MVDEKLYTESKAEKIEAKIAFKKNQLKQLLIRNISFWQNKIAESLNRSAVHLNHINSFMEHRHENHKHASYKGHRYDSFPNAFIKSGYKFRYIPQLNAYGSGTYYPFKYSLVDILFLEMNRTKDLDDNGLIFYRDFVIDLRKPVPPKIAALGVAHWYPGSSQYPYFDRNGDRIEVSKEYMSYLDPISGQLKYIKRDKDCIIISWYDYLKTVPVCFGGEKE